MTTDKSDPIKAEAARYKAATDAAKKSRTALTQLVIAALREPDAKPADIASRAEWTSAYVRKLARENGIEADPAYKARTEKARARLLAEAAAASAAQAAPEANERPSPASAPGERPRSPLDELGLDPRVRALTPEQARRIAAQVETEHFSWLRGVRKRLSKISPDLLPYAIANAALLAEKVQLPEA